MTQPGLSIIIVSWNVLEFLKECVLSVFQSNYPGLKEVIIVDNASTDGTVAWLETSYPNVKLVKNDVNEGFARACNKGYEVSSGDILLFLNPDTVIVGDCLEKTVSFIRSQPGCGLVGCKLLNPDMSLQPSVRKFITNFNLVMEHFSRLFPSTSSFRKKYDYTVFSHDTVEIVDWVIGAFMMINRPDFEKIGGFDDSFPLYYEDTDICYRVRQLGKNVYFYPGASVIHYGNRSGIKLYGNKTVLKYYEAKHRFIRKHYGIITLTFHRILMTCLLSWRLLLTLVSNKDFSGMDRNFLWQGIKLQWGVKQG